MENEELEQQEQEQEQPREAYKPRPAWQVAAAWVGPVGLSIRRIRYFRYIYNGGLL